MKTWLLVLALLLTLAPRPGGFSQKTASVALSTGETIAINDFKFTPQTLTVKAGTAVTWEDKEGTHTVTADDDSWASPTLTAGKTFTRKFPKPGTYPYHCAFHGSAGGGMSGSITVTR